MPAVISQSFQVVNNQTGIFTLVTTAFGTLVITAFRAGVGAGTTVTMTLTRDGAQVIQQVLNNPSITTCETWCSDQVANIVGASMQFRVHFYSINPNVTATAGCWNPGVTIPSVWW